MKHFVIVTVRDSMTCAAQRIFEIINDLGMTDYEFCIRYGFNRSTLNGWRNSNIDPGLEMIQRFCNAIGITMDEFYHEGVFSVAEEEIKVKNRELITLRILSKRL